MPSFRRVLESRMTLGRIKAGRGFSQASKGQRCRFYVSQSCPNYRESRPIGLGSQRILLGRAWPTPNQVACFGPAGKGVLTKGGVALPLGFDAGVENCRSLGCARDDTVPHLRRSESSSGLIPQPFRAGLTFGCRPSGPRIRGDCRCHFSLNLPQAGQLLGMTKGRATLA